MRAFNQRLAPKEFAGIPLLAAVALLVAFGSVVLTLMLPTFLKVVTGLIAGCGVALAVVVLRIGEDWPLRQVLLAARRERHAVATDTWSRE